MMYHVTIEIPFRRVGDWATTERILDVAARERDDIAVAFADPEFVAQVAQIMSRDPDQIALAGVRVWPREHQPKRCPLGSSRVLVTATREGPNLPCYPRY